MKHFFATMTLACLLSLTHAQSLTSTLDTKCEVQVAFAVSEGDAIGEYSMTEMISLEPGQIAHFEGRPFIARRLYARAELDEMFVVRFRESGVTHFLDATAKQGYERILVGGCTIDQLPSFLRDGSFVIDASAN